MLTGDHRAVVIAGSASVIGREAPLLFAREGAHVVAIDVNQEASATLLHATQSAGESAEASRERARYTPAHERLPPSNWLASQFAAQGGSK